MIISGCSLSLSNERKRFQEKIGLVWRIDEDPFGGMKNHIKRSMLIVEKKGILYILKLVC